MKAGGGALDLEGDFALLALLVGEVSTEALVLEAVLEEGLGVAVDVGDEPALGGVLDLALAGAAKVLDELGEGGPLGGVHVDMVAVGDILVVDDGGGNAGEAVGAAHEVEEGILKFFRVAVDNTSGVLAKYLHLALVGLAHAVAFEPVLVPALLLAHLAVPPQLLQTLRLYPVRDRLRRQEVVLSHSERSIPFPSDRREPKNRSRPPEAAAEEGITGF